jgi:hypothetical protein
MIVPQVSVDPVVVEEILIGTIGAIAALVGAIAVMKAALPAKGTITRSEERMHSVAAGAAVDDCGCTGQNQ